MLRSPLPRLESQMLWEHVLGVTRAWLIANSGQQPSPAQLASYGGLEARRQAGEPMAYILGRREFYGRMFRVTPAVLVPRPETELLLECGLEAISGLHQPRVLELGTGSGIVAVSIALECPGARVQASDYSAQALDLARENAQALGAKLLFSLGSWYDIGLSLAPYDLIISNPPYVGKDDTHLLQGDLRYEPQVALTDNADGLQALRSIIQGAPAHLAPGGALCVEHGWDQATAVRGLFQTAGFSGVNSLRDLAGIERVTWGRL